MHLQGQSNYRHKWYNANIIWKSYNKINITVLFHGSFRSAAKQVRFLHAILLHKLLYLRQILLYELFHLLELRFNY